MSYQSAGSDLHSAALRSGSTALALGYSYRGATILIPWKGDRCIGCLKKCQLTEEHLIPDALGGRLTVKFLCQNCNSLLGSRVEAAVRSDPTFRLLIPKLSNQIPAVAKALSEGQPHVAHSPGGKAKGRIKDGKFQVKSTKEADGSLIQPTPTARRAIDNILRREGYEAPIRARALQIFDEAPDNIRVAVAPGHEIVKWGITKLEPEVGGPLINPVVPLKIAFEFLACHLGTAIYEQTSPLDEIRSILAGADLSPKLVSVERLYAEDAKPFHGLIFEGNDPHAKVQIRLFGQLAFRVHLLRLAVGGPRFRYTHDLTTNEEEVVQFGRDGHP